MNLKILSLLQIVNLCHSQPILQDIANWISGIKYVPPQSDSNQEKISNEPSEINNLFQPVNKYSSTPAPTGHNKDDGFEEPVNVVFNRSGGWVQPAGSQYLYLIGKDAASFYESKYWCVEQGGQLAEIYTPDEMELVKSLVIREPETNYWLGLEKSSRTWLTGKSRSYQYWVEGEPNQRFSERCVVLQGRKQFRWAGWNCGYQKDGATLFKALCQKENKHIVTSTPRPVSAEIKTEVTSSKCAVFGVSLTGEDWISRHSNVSTAGQCHTDCRNTADCRFWTWRFDSKLCYLKRRDGDVVKDVLAVSGTTSRHQGCDHIILDQTPSSSSQHVTQVEYCTCKTVSHDVVAGYIDPRTLPVNKETDKEINIENKYLGRLIRHNACPHGQVLTCSEHNQIPDNRTPRSNITTCLVNDVRLSVGGHVGVISHVPTSATCHNHCMLNTGCVYWTWRGDTKDKKCFMLPAESRLVRRQGAASGTVSRDQGCNHRAQEDVPQYREDTDTCDCERDPEYDLVGSGLINPRTIPGDTDDTKSRPVSSGRIVNIDTNTCPPGYKKVCHEPKTQSSNKNNNGPQLFTGSLGLPALDQGWARERSVPRREISTDTKNINIETATDESLVAFPE